MSKKLTCRLGLHKWLQLDCIIHVATWELQEKAKIAGREPFLGMVTGGMELPLERKVCVNCGKEIDQIKARKQELLIEYKKMRSEEKLKEFYLGLEI